MSELQFRSPERAPAPRPAAVEVEPDWSLDQELGAEAELGPDEGATLKTGGAVPGPVADLKKRLEDPATTPDAVLATLYGMARDQPGAVTALLADRALFSAALKRLGPERVASGLLGLQFGSAEIAGRTLKDAGEWCLATTGLTAPIWMRLVAGKTATACAGALGSETLLASLRGLKLDPLNLLPGLAMDPAALGAALKSRPALGEWISAQGGAKRLVEIQSWVTAAGDAAAEREKQVAKGTWTTTLAKLPNGPITDRAMQQKLYLYLLATREGDTAEWNTLFQKRFGFALTGSSGVKWDKVSAIRMWQLADLTPGAQVKDIVKVIREGSSGEATGWAGDGEIGMEWGKDTLGATEVGLYTDDTDPMRGLNIFDATVRHEIGHIVGAENGYDQPGGFVYSQFGWDSHSDFEGLVRDTFLPARPLPMSKVTTGRDSLRERVITALGGVSSYSEADYRSAVERVQRGLWSQIAGEPLIQYLIGRSQGGAWDQSDPINGRSYHVAYDWFGFCSVPDKLYGTKPSTYAMRSPMEWFAEGYATYYAEADQPGRQLGTLLASRDPALAARFKSTVHAGGDTLANRGSVGGPAGASSAIKTSGTKGKKKK